VFQKQKASDGGAVAKSPAVDAKLQVQSPPASTSSSSTTQRPSQPSRTQSVPAPDTSGWTRVDEGNP